MNIRTKVFLALIIFCKHLRAEDIYVAESSSGVPFFSSSPLQNSKKADLPPILWEGEMKARQNKPEGATETTIPQKAPKHLTNKINSKVKDRKLESCITHGGINCEKGADKDGSVICADGFTESSALFSMRCSEGKLSIVDIKPGEFNKKNIATYTLYLRNTGAKAVKSPIIAIIKDGYSVISVEKQTIEPNQMQEVKVQVKKDAPIRFKLLEEDIVIN